MASLIWRKIKQWEKRYRARFTHDIVDPEQRRKSLFYNDWVDHGFLRYRWHNFEEITPGVYRSNHPNHERFESYKSMGIRTILNLRGATIHSHYKFEVESCTKLGLELIDIPLSARRAPTHEQLATIMNVLENLEHPTLMHCKSGADRTGLVSAIYLVHIAKSPPSEAKKMLSPRYMHLKFTSSGILDHVIDLYARSHAETGVSFREWAENHYDPVRARAEFDAMSFRARLAI